MIPLRWLQYGHNQESPEAPVTIVALHGWAADGDVWRALAEHCPNFNVAVFDLPGFNCPPLEIELDVLIDAMASAIGHANIPARQLVVLGWSLGGQLATLLAQRLMQMELEPRALITIASNPCFVATDDWPTAMAPAQFETFLTGFRSDPGATLTRFHRLQERGARDKKQLRQAIQALPTTTPSSAPAWTAALEWLRVDTRKQLASLPMPQLHILAEGDALVPSDAPLGQFGEVHRFAASHCLPLEVPAQLARSLRVFIASHAARARTKSQVANAFSSAASHYDNFAKVQKTVAHKVAAMAKPWVVSGATVIDLGIGTGTVLKQLCMDAPEATHFLGVDIAEGMVRHATSVPELAGTALCVADIEALPFSKASIDLAVSSLAVQWCNDLPSLFADVNRVLKPGAKAVIATLGPQTLTELKAAWRAVDASVHVNGFASSAAVAQAAEAAGFTVSIERHIEQLVYPELMPLLRELKAIGAHNMHTHARRGLMTKTTFAALSEAYARLPSGELAATYDVYYVRLEKNHG